MTYEEMQTLDLLTMDGGRLYAAFCEILTLSIENSVEAESVQKKLSEAESTLAHIDDRNERKTFRGKISVLKREEKINGIRSRAIDKLASRLQTLLRTYGK